MKRSKNLAALLLALLTLINVMCVTAFAAGESPVLLSASKDAIEAIIGEEVSAFAYPNGAYNDMVELFAEKHGYRFCYTTNPPTEPYYENTALPRSYVVRDMPMADFLALLTNESENDNGEH